jgi:putative pyoverdin transport system ATP-binding/permease protein
MKIIHLLLKNSSKTFYLAAICSFISGATSAGVIAVINHAIAHLDDLTIAIPLLFILLCIVFLIFGTLTLVLMTHLSQEIVYNLRLDMTQRILNCPLQHLENIGAPKLLATLTGDIEAIAQASGTISQLIVNLALLLGSLIYLCWLSPSVFIGFLLFMSIAFYSYQLLLKQGRKYFVLARQTQDILFKHFRTVTEGTKELKLHRPRRQSFIKDDLSSAAEDFKRYRISGMNIFAFANPWGIILFFIPLGLLVFVLPNFANISVAVISGYALTILYMINPLRAITISLPEITQANIALNKIDSLGISLSEKTIEPNFPTGSDFDNDWTSLELVDINHTYRGEREEHQFSLDNINLKFKPGELVFIVGGNGSGKSTLIKLITGLYTPDHGQILLNNIPVQDDNREWYRQQFSVVFYDFYLFERLLGIEANRETEIQNYLNLLEIQHKVTVNDGNLSTTNLSQGQRKRLALLTAYLEDRPIYVFDEWASDQDPVFKEIFYKKLLPQLKSRGKTVIAVSHDDRYFTECDRIIKLDYGRIIEDRYLS